MPYASGIQLINDANGTAYAFLADNGVIWQCQWNAEAQRWDTGQVVPGAFGGEKLQASILDNLWPTADSSGNNSGTAPGVVLAYRVDEGNNSQVMAVLGRWGSDEQLNWSEPLSLSATGVDVQEFALIQGGLASSSSGEGQSFSLVVQANALGKPPTTILDDLKSTPQDEQPNLLAQLRILNREDSDLYTSTFQLSGSTATELQVLQGTSESNTSETTPIWGFAASVTPALVANTPARPSSLIAGNTELSRQQIVPEQPTDSNVLGASNPTTSSNTPQQGTPIAYSGANGNFRAGGAPNGTKPFRWKVSNEKLGSTSVGELGGSSQNTSFFKTNAIDLAWNGSFKTFANTTGQPFGYSRASLGIGGGKESGSLNATEPTSKTAKIGKILKGGLAAGSVFNERSWGIGVGGSATTRYNFSQGKTFQTLIGGSPEVISVLAGVSAGVNANFKWVDRSASDNTVRFHAGGALGWQWQQYAANSDGMQPPIPEILKISNLATNAKWLGILGNTGYSLYKKKNNIESDPNKFGNSGLFAKGELGPNLLMAAVGTAMAAVGPIELALQHKRGFQNQDTSPTTYSAGNGFFEKGIVSLSGMYKSLIGLRGVFGESFNAYTSPLDGEGLSETIYVGLTGLLPLGVSIPLLSYGRTWSQPEQSAVDSALSSTETRQTGQLLASEASSDDYPFSYAPSSGSNSYFAPTPTGGKVNPYLLGNTESLQYFTLSTYKDAINPPGTTPSAPVTLYNPGSGLKDGIYTDVPIMAVGLDETTQAFAQAGFTVQNGSIVADTVQISQGGHALALPESTSGSGIYALLLDVFSTGIATPPNSAAGNPFNNLPLITVDSTKADSPLQLTSIQRIWSIPVDPLIQQQNQQSGEAIYLYPIYDPSTGQTSEPASNNNESYSYGNVGIQLLDSSGKPIDLLSNSVTATVILSNGFIQAIHLDGPLLFSGSAISAQLILPDDVTANITSIPLNPQDSVPATLPPELATPSFAVVQQDLAFNNFVDDEQFSGQVGVADAGVYLAGGMNDAIPLLPQMGAWPVQNRVVYATRSTNGLLSSTILNAQDQTENGLIAVPSSSEPSLEDLYDNPSQFFSAASQPTAVTISGSNSRYGGDTFVAWVEASDVVIPITSSDGNTNYQAYMQALYGEQRINYRIQTNGNWLAPSLSDLYKPDNAVITELKAFNVANPSDPGSNSTLLVWSEVSISAIQELTTDANISEPQAVIKAGFLNPNASSIKWSDLFTVSNNGSSFSTIQAIPWEKSSDVLGLGIEDISASSQTLLLADGRLAQAPVISWSQKVRTPYRQSVLDDSPTIFLDLGELESGLNTINIGSIQEPSTTTTLASSTGLNFSLPGALPQSVAVQNTDGTGVLTTGLGSSIAFQLQLARSVPTDVAVFTGSINDNILSISSLAAGQPKVGDVLSGAGITPGTTITSQIGSNSYELSLAQTSIEDQRLQALPRFEESTSFSGSINETMLTVAPFASGNLQIGDFIIGDGVAPGTRITEVIAAVSDSTPGSYSVSISQATEESAVLAIPATPSDAYTIEFWAKLGSSENNFTGAGLVAFGQPSSEAVGTAVLPSDWLLGASFVVDRISYQQALSLDLITELPSNEDLTATYAWEWAVIATGADTTATNGGGSNLYSNSLEINNLVGGTVLKGVNDFLSNYKVSASELVGLYGATADTIASVPFTALEFANYLDDAGNPVSELNGIAVDTSSAVMNAGLLLAENVAPSSSLDSMFQSLWNYQQRTGEAKVSFDLAPNSDQLTVKVEPTSNEQYSGYELGFSLLSGLAVSVNGEGQLVFDVAPGQSLISESGIDWRDGEWHYVVATYLPEYEQITVNGEPITRPTLQGTASLVVDNKVVASDNTISAAFAAQNLSDQALLLANNFGGGIDQFAIYDKALTQGTPPAGAAGIWPQISSEDALAALAVLSSSLPGQTNTGTLPGAISEHWAARNVNPNDALQATYTSSFDPSDGWSTARPLNPQLATQSTSPSASAPGSLQNDLVITIPSSTWTNSGWDEAGGNTTADGFFNPVNQQLQTVTVTLTDTETGVNTTLTLNSDQVLLGGKTLQSLQPQALGTTLNYTVLSEAPAFSLVIPGNQIKLSDSYKATYSFTFNTGSSTTTLSNATPVPVNVIGGTLASDGLSNNSLSTKLADRNKALATAAVLEQASLQLEYVDSGEVFRSQVNTGNSSKSAVELSPESFGQSQVFGSFSDGNSTNGWLAIAQPISLNAESNPAGRIWIQYTGQSSSGVPSSDSSLAPSTWLDALADSNFSPDSPNLPLLDDGISYGGLLIQADPTAGWGQQLGDTMLVADINGDSILDLVIAAPASNSGGRVYIIDGTWIQENLTKEGSGTILDLANPEALGPYVTILKPKSESISSTIEIDTSVAGFGTALAFDSNTQTLWIGAPNALQQLDPTNENPDLSLVPVGAIYSYSYTSSSDSWGTASPQEQPIVYQGQGGTAITPDPAGTATTSYWGSKLGSAIAISEDGQIAFSAPGVVASLEYSGTQQAQAQATGQKSRQDSSYGDGALLRIQLPSESNQYSVSTTQGANNGGLIDVASDSKTALYGEGSAYMQNLKYLQSATIADATVYYNQALQALPVGALFLFDQATDLPQSGATLIPGQSWATFYGPNPWNVLGPSNFGSSLSFADLANINGKPFLAVGADQTGSSGAVYLIDTSQSFTDPSSQSWIADINLQNNNKQNNNEYLAYLASSFTLYGAASTDNFGNGLVNLGDVNGDNYEDLLIQAFNASAGAGNGYLLFGSDQIISADSTTNNTATGNVAVGTIGQMTRADGSTLVVNILNEIGYGPTASTGLGSFGVGDVNGDGLPDILLGAGGDSSAYITWGHPYLEAISTIALEKLTSDTGYMLDGLATTTAGSLRSVGDFNGDGYGDFISIQPGEFVSTVRIELGANTQEILADYLYSYYTFTVSSDTQVLPAGDINGDGLADIALFLNENLSSADDGNQGAGSTTGILYGRSSDQLPIGSGFGFLSPVDPATNAPLAAVPSQQISAGLSSATPAVIVVDDTLYAAVQGVGEGDTSVWFAKSDDAGNSWSDWTNLSSTDQFFATSTAPSLAFFEQKLYMSFLDTNGSLRIANFNPGSNSLSDWSSPELVYTADITNIRYKSHYTPQLLNQGNALAVIWIDADDGTIYSAVSTTPDQASVNTWTAPKKLLERVETNGSVSFLPIKATAAPTATMLGTASFVAINNNGTINVYGVSPSGASLVLASSFTGASATAPSITSTETGLALTYTNPDQSISLERIELLNLEPEPGWQSTNLSSDQSGLSTNIASAPLSINGNLLLSSVDAQTNAVLISAIPNLSDPSSVSWINSTIQLPSDSNGWLINQLDTSSLSSLTAVGDLNGDGMDDLVVANSALSIALIDDASPWIALGDGASSVASPALAQLGDVLYMAVQSNTGGSNIYWSSSTDNGNTWADFQALPSTMTSVLPPSLAVFEGTLYLGYLGDGNNEIYITSLLDAQTNSWTEAYQVPYSGGTQSALYASLVTEFVDGGNQLAIYYISTNESSKNNYASDLLRTATSYPSSASGWSGTISNVNYNNSSPQTASGPLAVSSINGQTVIAYQGGTVSAPSQEIYLTTSATPSNSSTWTLQSVLDPGLNTGLGLIQYGETDLLLSYSDSNETDSLQLQSFSLNSGSWTSTGVTTTPLTASGSTNISILNSTTNNSETLLFAGINTSDSNGIEVKTASPRSSRPGLRLITGAPSPAQFEAFNNPNLTRQNVQLAPPLPANNGSATLSVALNTNGTFQLTADGDLNLSTLGSAQIDDTSLIASSTLSSAQKLFANTAVWSSLTPPPLTGSPSLNTSTSFGDLNGDGYNDYFDPTDSRWIASTPEAPVFSLWSIRATGDVNGNGVDDVLLALTPQGPSYPTQSDGSPSAIYSVLVDGALFNVDPANNTFNLGNLKQGLNPYNRVELYDVESTTSYSDEYQSLQNWFVPILTYQAPISITSVSTIKSADSIPSPNSAGDYFVDGTNNSPAPTILRDDRGNLYAITTQVQTDSLGNFILIGKSNSLDLANLEDYLSIDVSSIKGATDFPFNSIAPLTPGAAIHDGKLFISIPVSGNPSSGYGRATNNIWIAFADLDNINDSSSWSTYQVRSDGNTNAEYSLLTPTLVSEGNRLAIYFPAGDAGNNDENLNIHYLYSSDPVNSSSWGGTYESATNSYSGSSKTIAIDASHSTTPSVSGWASSGGILVTSPISATTYQGRTVLAFRGYGDGSGDNVENGSLLLAFAPAAHNLHLSTTTNADWTLWDTTTTGINTPAIATDQANLYITYTPWSTSSTGASFFPVSLNAEKIKPDQILDASNSSLITAGTTHSLPITLQQAGDNTSNRTNIGMTSPDYAGGYFLNKDKEAKIIGNAPNSVAPFFFGDSLYVTNQIGDSAAVAIEYNLIEPPFGENQINQSGLSLAGYSIDGNIDINGDGFTDMLISDPSDPSLAVDNQYALFGGDFLDIASWVGTTGADNAVGTPLADVIYTLAGDDQVISMGGSDVIYTGAGADTISISNHDFLRIDAGSGIDLLSLEGEVNQDYNFSLSSSQPEYFAGTKLRNIEIINSSDYGSNTLSFDPQSISQLNESRIVFVIPDKGDFIHLYPDQDYQFARNSTYDTSFGGLFWNAYAAELINAEATINPALVYVLAPSDADSSWLESNVIIQSSGSDSASFATTQAIAEPQLPRSSPIASEVLFGNGLTLSAYKTSLSSGVARFVVSRSNTSGAQVVSYVSSSLNSTVEPGQDYTAIAGVIRFEPGQSSQAITVPLNTDAFEQLRNAELSLELEELTDEGQQPVHLLIQAVSAGDSSLVSLPVLSSFKFEPSETDGTAILSFRADSNANLTEQKNGVISPSELNLKIAERISPDSNLETKSEIVIISDFVKSSQLESIVDPVTGIVRLDADNLSNNQIAARIQVNLNPSSSDARLELLGADTPTLSGFALTTAKSFSLQANSPLTVWRSDSGSGSVELSLQSDSGDSISLLSDASPGEFGSINPGSWQSNWISTEGKTVGSQIAYQALYLANHAWTPVASRNGQALDLLDLSINGNQLTASFAGGVSAVIMLDSTPITPTQQLLHPEVTINRLAGYNNHLAFYKLDDVTGLVDGFAPSAEGYLDAALARAQNDGLYLNSEQLPGYGQTATYTNLNLDPNSAYGILCVINGNTNRIVSSFSDANPDGSTQFITLSSIDSPGVITYGIEDIVGLGSDRDFNDLIVSIKNSPSIPIF